MPDWSYRTVLRLLLFRLPPVAARDLTLGLMGTLGRSPFGPDAIDFLGHMRPPAALRRERLGLDLPTVVGLGCGLDPDARAVSAFARFGVGFVEVGPVTPRPLARAGPIERSEELEAIVTPDPPPNPGVDAIVRALVSRPARDVPIIVRLAVAPGTGPEQAAERVVLAYDEHFVGLTREQLVAINERLLPFMAHDRATLAGTMMTIGVLYTGLSLFGVRAGQHWARAAILSSGLVGFATFFLFLGFGYFEPFHAFVTAILFQFFLLGLHCRLGEPRAPVAPGLWDDWRWRLSQWGQLGLIAQAVGFVVAGLTVSIIGITQVFVAEDLEFMQTTAEALVAAGPRLVPLVAHDRATFGGMLLCAGLIFLMAGLWGFGRGARWLWWTVLVAGLTGYGAAFGIHYAVDYSSPWHLAPAWAGLALFLGAMGLSYPHLCGRDPALEEAWRDHRARWARRRPAVREQ